MAANQVRFYEIIVRAKWFKCINLNCNNCTDLQLLWWPHQSGWARYHYFVSMCFDYHFAIQGGWRNIFRVHMYLCDHMSVEMKVVTIREYYIVSLQNTFFDKKDIFSAFFSYELRKCNPIIVLIVLVPFKITFPKKLDTEVCLISPFFYL